MTDRDTRSSSILLFSWAIIQILIYFRYDIFSSIDTEFYLKNANNILQGEWPNGRSIMYLSYTVLLTLIQWLGFRAEGIVFIQLVASLFALFSIYVLAKDLYKNELSGFIGAALYLFWIKIHQWNFILYTDSLFTSFSIISFTLFYFSNKQRDYVLASIVLLFTIFIRPNGIGLFIAISGYLLSRFSFIEKAIYKKGLIGLIALLVIVIVNQILEAHIESFIKSYSIAEIIYPSRQLFISPIEDLVAPKSDWPALLQLIVFIIYNPIYFGKLFFLKAFLFLANVKPYFSWVHNVVIIMVLYPIYCFAVFGYKRLQNHAVKIFVSLFIGLQLGIVGLTSENWDGRFLIPLLPIIFILAAGELSVMTKNFSHELGE